MDLDFDIHRSLLELDPETWQPDALEADIWPVAQRIASRPVRKLSPADLEWLLSNQLCLRYAVPLAMDRLAQDPFLQAARHSGDLLTAVLEVDSRFWLDNYEWWLEMAGILEQALRLVTEKMQAEGGEYLPWHIGDELIAAALHFRGLHHVRDGGE